MGLLDFEYIPLFWVVVPVHAALVPPALLHLLFPTLLQFLHRCDELDGKMNPGWGCEAALSPLFFTPPSFPQVSFSGLSSLVWFPVGNT